MPKDIEYERELEDLKAAFGFAQSGLRGLFVLNAGSAAGLLAFAAQDGDQIVGNRILLYAAVILISGCLLSVLASLSMFLRQNSYFGMYRFGLNAGDPATEVRFERKGRRYTLAAHIAIWSSMACFVVGTVFVAIGLIGPTS